MKNLLMRLVIAIFAVVLLVPSVIANAKLSSDQIAIGGITYKSSLDYIYGIYGPPDFIESGSVYCWGYNSLEVYTWGPHGQTNYATEIRCKKNNGLATPAGVTVGMPVSVLNDLYGRADYTLDSDREGNTVYTYFGEAGPCLVFRVLNNKIREIWVIKDFTP